MDETKVTAISLKDLTEFVSQQAELATALKFIQEAVSEIKEDLKDMKSKDDCATCRPAAEIKNISEKLDEHIEGHKDTKANSLVIIGLVITFVLGAAGLLLQII